MNTKISIDSKDSKTLELFIQTKTTKKRFRDIKKYQSLIDKGTKIGLPLYITGRSLNFLGASIENNSIFILDGSRRLVANILNDINPDILLIDLKDSYIEKE